MKLNLIKYIALFVSVSSYSQACRDNIISKKFDFEISSKSTDSNDLGSVEIKIKIFSHGKKNLIQIINIESKSILKSKSFRNCSDHKSYLKNVNSVIKAYDYDFGDVIVADFNFDGKEDLAIKREEGGNGGPLYNFYLQSENKRFLIDNFLSNEMKTFPYFFDTRNKFLRVSKRIDSIKYEIITYQYFSKNNLWKVKSKSEYNN